MIERSTAFKRDYKHIKATPRYKKDLDTLISNILKCLLMDQSLPEKNLDHPLNGNWNGYRKCHVKSEYKKPDQFTLRLARLGSHSELFD